MIDINEYSDVLTFVEGEDKYLALNTIITKCSIFRKSRIKINTLFHRVVRREKLSSTEIGHSIAISHGKVHFLRHTVIALGISKEGILFREDKEKVHLIFVIASPFFKNIDYLISISYLLSWVYDEKKKKEIENLEDTETVREFLNMLKTGLYKKASD